MKSDLKAKLDATFQKVAADKASAEQRRLAKHAKESAFVGEILIALDTIVKPAMTEIGEYLRAQGYDYQISTKDEISLADKRSGPTPASVTVEFYQRGVRQAHGQTPHLTVSYDRSKEEVTFHECTIWGNRGGHSGGAGTTTLSLLTEDLVQERLLKIINEVFR